MNFKIKTTILLIVFILLKSFSGISQELPYYVSPKDLLLWLPLEGTTLDKSGEGNDASGNNLVHSADRFGREDRAVYLDGINSYLMIEVNQPQLMLSNNFTIAFWVSANYSNNLQYLISKGDKMSNEFALTLSPNNNLCLEKNPETFKKCIPFIKNQWTNITFSVQNNTAKIYLDGKFSGTFVLESPILPSNLPFTFGSLFQAGTNTPIQNSRFNGKMDDIAIWNRVLSADEILLFYKGEEN
ncbi:MAG: LamG domain-containing protein [Bacteroidota bacterium]|jgi:hypothetical protein